MLRLGAILLSPDLQLFSFIRTLTIMGGPLADPGSKDLLALRLVGLVLAQHSPDPSDEP